MRVRRNWIAGLALCLCVTGMQARSGSSEVRRVQYGPPVNTTPPTRNSAPVGDSDRDPMGDPMRVRMQAQAVRSGNEDRHKHIASDAAKLLELSTELKADVDKTTKDQMSMEVIRKAAEIEKLAHDVHQRMIN